MADTDNISILVFNKQKVILYEMIHKNQAKSINKTEGINQFSDAISHTEPSFNKSR